MADFAGLIRFDGKPVDDAAIARLGRSVLSHGPAFVWRPDRSVVLVEGRPAAPLGSPPQAPPQQIPGRVLLADVWLATPDEIASALDVDRSSSERSLVSAACARWGLERAIERLDGDVAIAVWDQERRQLTMARDALGGPPIYYVTNPDFVLFATSLQTMLAMPETPRDLDLIVLAHTLTIALKDQEQTIYQHVRRAPPGGFAAFEAGKQRTWRYYTRERIAPVRFGADDDYVEAARELLDKAVACRLPPAGPYACELSGGFDSGGIAATAARLLSPGRLTAYTRVSSGGEPAGGLDERYLAGKLVERYPNIDWAIVDDARESPRDLFPESEAGALLVPRTGSFNNAWFESLMLAVEHSGAPVLLNGSVGNYTLSYEGPPALISGLRGGNLADVHRNLRSASSRFGVSYARATAGAVFQSFAPRWLKRWRVQRRHGETPWRDFSLVSPQFLAEIDYAAEARAVGHDVPFDLPYDSQEIRLRMLQGQRGADFRGFLRRKWRVTRRDPYRDRRLVDFCLGIPDDQYRRAGQSRWLARRVLADRVPAETLAEQRRGRQSPEWHATASRRRDGMADAIDRIERSPLAARVLDIPRMRALLDDWPKDAESAQQTVNLHGHALQRGIAMGGFLRWHEGRND